MAPNPPGRIPADTLFAVGFSRINDFARHHPVLDDLLVVVNVIDEQVERLDPLFEPLFDPAPFGSRNDPREDVEGKYLLQARLLAINVESDAHLQQGTLGGLL